LPIVEFRTATVTAKPVRNNSGELEEAAAATVEPQAGYPWRVGIETIYTLGPDGLTQSVRATNNSSTPAPCGSGTHPYLVARSGSANDWTLELPARQVLLTNHRLSPTDLVEVTVDPDRFDFRVPHFIGAVEIDHAFTALERDSDNYATVRLTDHTGQGVAMVWNASCSWVQIHTADLPGGPNQSGHRAGLAVELMTYAPDAFNAPPPGDSPRSILLDVGGSAVADWRIVAVDRDRSV
jgi:aldose 1-epimerase